MNKDELIRVFQRDWEKYWKIDFLVDLGFSRRRCVKCGKYFWSIREQSVCNDSTCREYEFIGNPRGRRGLSYEEAWNLIRDFFVRNDHVNIDRYPVVCRWFPLNFTIAGIVNFYRMVDSQLDFEFPAHNIIMLQPSLRFNDVDNVGITGRHWTCHSHVEQASLYDGENGYWKERCIELDYNLLTKVIGIKPEEITFIEDVWIGAGAFGYSLEYHVAGLELGNAVFTEFFGSPGNYRVMDKRVIDMGAGLERFCWITQGCATSYDAVFRGEIRDLIEISGLDFDEDLLLKYSRFSSSLDIEDFGDFIGMWNILSSRLKVDPKYLRDNIEPIQAIYAIIDHVRALAFAIVDGGIPSNVGGGYNLRAILRRALSLISRYNFNFDIYYVLELVAKRFRKIHPELLENLDYIKRVIEVEEKRYARAKEKAVKMVSTLISTKGGITLEKLIELYDSHGVTPELAQELALKKGVKIEIPPDFYSRVTERHRRKVKVSREEIELKDITLSPTEILYYDGVREFDAKVLKIIGNELVLDRTAFYPVSGGQDADRGRMISSTGECRVVNVRKIGNVILHKVDKVNVHEGEVVHCIIDWSRRKQLMQHHTATHIINYASRRILGPHVWQHGTSKTVKMAHLDITHYENLTEGQVEEIQRLANEIVKMNLEVKSEILKRGDAERKYGFRIYQGGPPTSRLLRIISIGNLEHEACGGTHCNYTSEVEEIVIVNWDRIQDGVVRLNYVAGEAAKKLREKYLLSLREVAKLLGVSDLTEIPSALKLLISKINELGKKVKVKKKEYIFKLMENLSNKFVVRNGSRILVSKVMGNFEILKELSKKLSSDDTIVILLGLAESKVHIFISCGKNTKRSARDLCKIICSMLNGKGGGSDIVATGIGEPVNLEDIEERILEVL
ncbi:MAG: alanine--tRNA ligase [archaeon GB-1867-035]|nr:alanine--tRNA ligase [Candidatus Culexmicrobium profundum]